MRISRPRWIIGFALAGVAAVLAGLLLFAWSGAYNIAASRGHWAIIEWFLAFGMRNSVELRSNFIEAEVPPLDNPDLYTLGAGHFHGGCAYCHGAPGSPINPVARHMLPPPPDLSRAAEQWQDRELFWIVKHGIKYTGMPAWVSQRRDDEVWAVVAFLKRLPRLDAAVYRELALGGLRVAPQSARDLATEDAWPSAVNACGRCHGSEGRWPSSNLVPLLHGQPHEFLVTALNAYASGQRESGIMQPPAAELDADAIDRLARYYSGLSAPSASERGATVDPEHDGQGRVLANEGAPDQRIPACNACHGNDALASYPRLAGQNAAYMAGRLRRWKGEFPPGSPTDSIMAPIARLLNDQQIDAVTSYFANLPTVRSEQGSQR
jgi:cytochrome c553